MHLRLNLTRNELTFVENSCGNICRSDGGIVVAFDETCGVGRRPPDAELLHFVIVHFLIHE